MRHPIQPLEKDDKWVLRFKKNRIVSYLLNAGPFDMNQLAIIPFDDEDREQFAQLIGYSLSGFSDLSYVSDEIYEQAKAQAESDIALQPKDTEGKNQQCPTNMEGLTA